MENTYLSGRIDGTRKLQKYLEAKAFFENIASAFSGICNPNLLLSVLDKEKESLCSHVNHHQKNCRENKDSYSCGWAETKKSFNKITLGKSFCIESTPSASDTLRSNNVSGSPIEKTAPPPERYVYEHITNYKLGYLLGFKERLLIFAAQKLRSIPFLQKFPFSLAKKLLNSYLNGEQTSLDLKEQSHTDSCLFDVDYFSCGWIKAKTFYQKPTPLPSSLKRLPYQDQKRIVEDIFWTQNGFTLPIENRAENLLRLAWINNKSFLKFKEYISTEIVQANKTIYGDHFPPSALRAELLFPELKERKENFPSTVYFVDENDLFQNPRNYSSQEYPQLQWPQKSAQPEMRIEFGQINYQQWIIDENTRRQRDLYQQQRADQIWRDQNAQAQRDEMARQQRAAQQRADENRRQQAEAQRRADNARFQRELQRQSDEMRRWQEMNNRSYYGR